MKVQVLGVFKVIFKTQKHSDILRFLFNFYFLEGTVAVKCQKSGPMTIRDPYWIQS